MPDNNPGYGKPALLVGVGILIGLSAALGFLAGQRAGKPVFTADQTPAVTPVPAVADAASFIATIVGSWQGADEQLLVKNDKGVIEILRETQLEDGKVRLDQFAAAPLRLDGPQRKLFLDMPDGLWQLTLIPGTRRAQLSITYPDKRNVLYQ